MFTVSSSITSTITIPKRRGLSVYHRNLDLIYLLVVARIKAWIQGRLLGFSWWLLEPLAMTFAYMVMIRVFSNDIHNRALYIMCAILPWTWFMTGTGQAMRSLTGNSGVLKSIRVNYAMFPIAEVLASSVRFIISFGIIILLMMCYKVTPTIHICWIPLLIITQLILTLGISFYLALAQVFIPDTTNAWQIITRIWFLLSPALYTLEQAPNVLRGWLLLNPFSTIFESYRDVLIEGNFPEIPLLLAVFSLGLFLCLTGYSLLNKFRGLIPLHL